MIDTGKLERLIREAVADEGSFLVDYSVDPSNRILVEVDNINGISLEQLTRISRSVESELDRDEEDFSLEVTSPGLGSPLKVTEQYEKSVGRPVKITLTDGNEIKGDLTSFDGKALNVTWKERVPKENGKGKRTVQREERIEMDKIKETRLEIRF